MKYEEMFGNELSSDKTKKIIEKLAHIEEPRSLSTNDEWFCGYSKERDAYLFVGVKTLRGNEMFLDVEPDELRKYFEETMLDFFRSHPEMTETKVAFCHLQIAITASNLAMVKAHYF